MTASVATLDYVRDRLTVLGRYGKGWDGYHADALKLESAHDALLYAGQNELPAALRVTMDPDGEVAFYFEANGRPQILDFPGNGTVHSSEQSEFRWEYLGEAPLLRDRQHTGLTTAMARKPAATPATPRPSRA